MMANNNDVDSPRVLTPELIEFIRQWKDRPGNLIMVLHKVQEVFGYVPRDIAFEVARRLDVPLAKIYGVLTFYHLFKLRKPGRHQIAVCMGTACYLKGAEELISEIGSLLDIGVNGITEDGEFSLESVRCIGCCGLAPVMTIDGEVYGRLTREMIPEILAKYKGQ
jgi:NADH-quinone oxidoreductase subunit E